MTTVCVNAPDVGASIILSTGFMSKFDYHQAMRDGHGYNLYIADLLANFGVPRVDVPAFSIATTHDEIKEKSVDPIQGDCKSSKSHAAKEEGNRHHSSNSEVVLIIIAVIAGSRGSSGS